MTTLCYAKKTCSIGIHVLLEELGVDYDLKIVDFSKAEQKTPEYKAINPKGKVPALVRDDGSVLTEYAAIALWLAMTHPERKLLPGDPEGIARTVEATDFVVGTVHMLSWRLWRRPDAYSDNPEEHEQLRNRGQAAMLAALEVVDAQLEGKEFIGGSHVGLADILLFCFLTFGANVGQPLNPDNANVSAWFERMQGRPSAAA